MGKFSHCGAYLLRSITDLLHRPELIIFVILPFLLPANHNCTLFSCTQVLKLHEMNVEIERPKLLAARRLGEAFKQRQLSLSAAAASNEEEAASDTSLGTTKLPRSETSSRVTNLLKASPEDEGADGPPLEDVPPRSGISV